MTVIKNTLKLEITVITLANVEWLKYKYDYHFIIKELVEEFKGHFECLAEIQKNI